MSRLKLVLSFRIVSALIRRYARVMEVKKFTLMAGTFLLPIVGYLIYEAYTENQTATASRPAAVAPTESASTLPLPAPSSIPSTVPFPLAVPTSVSAPEPDGSPLPPGRVPIYRFFDVKITDFQYSRLKSVGDPDYSLERVAFEVADEKFEGSTALYLCYLPTNGGRHHFLSGTENCEGYSQVTRLGFIATNPRQGAKVALVRCWGMRELGGRHLITVDTDECARHEMKVEGPLGYVR